jgi:hypothetical protein
VIGNSAYSHAAELPNPRHDAADIAAALRKLGFEVVSGTDLDKTQFDRTILRFAEKLAGAEVAAFFYAGHALQVGGVNYLVPTDARLSTAYALEFEMVRLDKVQRVMEGASPTNVLFLDACRDNPLARNLARALGTRSAGIGKGLAQVEAGIGTLISYATQPGAVALDGEGRNSPYSAALKAWLLRPGEDLTSMLIGVRNDVLVATASRQVPWDQHALRARLYLNGTRQVSAATAAPPPPPASSDRPSAAKDMGPVAPPAVASPPVPLPRPASDAAKQKAREREAQRAKEARRQEARDRERALRKQKELEAREEKLRAAEEASRKRKAETRAMLDDRPKASEPRKRKQSDEDEDARPAARKPAENATVVFDSPRIGSHRADGCYSWPGPCNSKQQADAYCRLRGFARAASFEASNKVGGFSAKRLGDGGICRLSCTLLTQVSCTR